MKKHFLTKLAAMLVLCAMLVSLSSVAFATEKLVFWNQDFMMVDEKGVIPSEELMVNQVVAQFEKDFDCEVEMVTMSDDLYQMFLAAGIAQDGPDLCTLWTGAYTTDYAAYIEPLDSYFTAEELEPFGNLDLCRDGFTSEGALLGLPYDNSVQLLFYNKDIMIEAGVLASRDEDLVIANYDEWMAICDAIAAAGYQPMCLNDAGDYSFVHAISQALAFTIGSEGVLGLGNGNTLMSDERVADTVQKWVDFTAALMEKGYINADAFSSADGTYSEPFFNGTAGFWIDGTWSCGNVYSNLGEASGVMIIPATDGNAAYPNAVCAQAANNMVVTSYSEHKELAVELMKRLASAESLQMVYDQYDRMPGRSDVELSEVEGANPLIVECYAWLDNHDSVMGYDSLTSADAASESYVQWQMLELGTTTVADALAAIDAVN